MGKEGIQGGDGHGPWQWECVGRFTSSPSCCPLSWSKLAGLHQLVCLIFIKFFFKKIKSLYGSSIRKHKKIYS